MKVVSVTCNHCGGPLELPRKVRFVTCGYCSSKLQIQREGNAVYSEVMERIDQRTEKMADDLEVIKAQNELERLDREWQMGLERRQVRNKDGLYEVPSSGGSIGGGVVAIVFGIFWTTMASRMGAPGIFPLFGLVFIAAAFFGMVNGVGKATAYQNDRKQYETRRRDLLRQSGANRGGH